MLFLIIPCTLYALWSLCYFCNRPLRRTVKNLGQNITPPTRAQRTLRDFAPPCALSNAFNLLNMDCFNFPYSFSLSLCHFHLSIEY